MTRDDEATLPLFFKPNIENGLSFFVDHAFAAHTRMVLGQRTRFW